MIKILLPIRRRAIPCLALVGLALASLFSPTLCGLASADGPQPMSRAQVEKIVHDYLIHHPEVIQEAISALEHQQAEAEDTARTAAVDGLKDKLFASTRQITLGNPKGDVTVVEFFDYNCPYCRRSLPDITHLIDTDGKLRFILKELPVLGPDSVEAARVAVAVRLVAPDKYRAFHEAMLGQSGRINGEKALAIAGEVGIDAAALKARFADKEIEATLEETEGLAGALGLNGTPSYVIGKDVVPGAIDGDELAQRIASIRRCGKSTC